MTIIEDTRQQSGKHDLKHEYFEKTGVKVVRSKLPVGDYANIKNMSVIVDTKQNIQEVISNVTQQHKRFVAECDLAKESDIQLIILVENEDGITKINDLYKWWNPRTRFSQRATTGRQLAKILTGIECRHGVRFEFCRPEEAGKRIVDLLPDTEGNNETSV